MKNLIASFAFLFVSYAMMGQYVKIGEKPMSGGTFSGYTVSIDGMDEKVVAKEWQQFMKEYSGKTKRDRKSGEQTTTGAAIGGLGGNVNVRASSVELGSNVQHVAWFESDEVYVSEENESESDIVVGIMERFIVHMKSVRIEMELDAEAKHLKSLQKELNQEEKNEQRQHDDIAKFEKKIEEAKANIVESVNAQEQKTADIEAQQLVIEAVKNRLNNVSLEDEVIEKEVKKAVKDVKKTDKKKNRNEN